MGTRRKGNILSVYSYKQFVPLTCRPYRGLWLVLKIIGIHIWEVEEKLKIRRDNSWEKKCCKRIQRIFFPCILSSYLIYVIFGSAAVAALGEIHPEVIFTFYGVNLLTLALWRAIYRRKISLRSLLIKCDKMSSGFQKQAKDIRTFVKISLIISVVVTLLTASGCATVLQISPPAYRMYYTFFLPLEEGTALCLLTRNVATILSFVTMYFIPCLVSVLCCVVYSMISGVSSMLSEELRDLHRKISDRDEMSKLLHKHYQLLQLIQKVENELSSVSFLLLCSQILNMYKALAIYIALSNDIIFTALFWDCISPVTLVPLSLVGVVWYASRISFYISSMKTFLQLSYNSSVLKNNRPWKMKSFLKTMMETEFPTITSGGMVELKPNLIFSVFGSLLTYGLLIRNVKKD